MGDSEADEISRHELRLFEDVFILGIKSEGPTRSHAMPAEAICDLLFLHLEIAPMRPRFCNCRWRLDVNYVTMSRKLTCQFMDKCLCTVPFLSDPNALAISVA